MRHFEKRCQIPELTSSKTMLHQTIDVESSPGDTCRDKMASG